MIWEPNEKPVLLRVWAIGRNVYSQKIRCEALYTSMICKNHVFTTFFFLQNKWGWKGKSPYPSCLGMAYHQSVHFTLYWFYQCSKNKFHLLWCSWPVLRLDMLYLGSDLKVKVCIKEKVLENFWFAKERRLKTCDSVCLKNSFGNFDLLKRKKDSRTCNRMCQMKIGYMLKEPVIVCVKWKLDL